MGIDIFEFYHGAVLSKLLYTGKELKIKTIKAVLYKKQNTGGGFIFKYLD